MAGKACAGLMSALAAATMGVEHAYVDGPFNFAPFSGNAAPPPVGVGPSKEAAGPTSPLPPPPLGSGSASEPEQPPKPRNDYPRTTSAGFDPEALERGAKALKEITNSGQAKKDGC